MKSINIEGATLEKRRNLVLYREEEKRRERR